MPRRVIDTAVVEYVPDFSAFGRETQRQLQAAFRGVERTAETSAESVEHSFDEAARVLDRVFEDVEREATRSFETVERVADRAGDDIGREFERGGEVAERALDELSDRAKREMAEVSATTAVAAQATGRSFNKLGLAASAAFLGVGAAATAGLGALTFMGLQSAAQLEQLRIGFNALTGSAEEGAKVFKQLQDFSARTPFEFPDVANAAKRFLAFNDAIGMTDAQLLGFLTTIGDVTSVVGTGAEGMNRIAFALGQIASKGKLSLEELNQISEAVPGFSAVAAIANATGMTTAEVMEQISAGAIDAQTGVAALLEGMRKFPGAAGAMEMQSQTLLGVFSTFKDVIGQTLASAFEPAIPAIKQALKDITPVIGDALGQIAPALGQLLAGALPLLGSIIKLLAPVLGPILGALGDALKELGPSLEALGPPLADILVELVPILPLLAELIKLVLMLLIPALKVLVPLFQLLGPVLEFIAKAVGQFVTWLERINWGAVGRAIGGAFTRAWSATKNFFVGIGRFVAALPARLGRAIASIPDLLQRIIAQTFANILRGIGVWIGLIVLAVTRLPGLIIAGLRAAPGLLFDFFSGLWNRIVSNAEERRNKIIQFLKELPGLAISALRSLGPLLVNLFTNTMNRARDTVKRAIDTVVSFFRNLPRRLGSFAMDIASGIVNFVKRFINGAISRVNEGIAKIDEIVPGGLPRIPLLARGGIAFGPALVGEDASTGPEAAIPLGDQRALRMLRDALGGTGSVTFSPGAIVINVQGDVSPQRAAQVGKTVGQNIASVLTARDIRTAVRVS